MDRDRKRTLRKAYLLGSLHCRLCVGAPYSCHIGKGAPRSAVLRNTGDGLRGDTAFMLKISASESSRNLSSQIYRYD